VAVFITEKKHPGDMAGFAKGCRDLICVGTGKILGNGDSIGAAMTIKPRLAFRVLCLAFAISPCFLSAGSSNAADRDDHSYLPPWMLDESGEARKVDENADLSKPARAKDVQPAKVEAQPVKTSEPGVPDLTAKATQARTKVVGFVSNLFQRSLRFATGE
jgi:hypothetical protein